MLVCYILCFWCFPVFKVINFRSDLCHICGFDWFLSVLVNYILWVFLTCSLQSISSSISLLMINIFAFWLSVWMMSLGSCIVGVCVLLFLMCLYSVHKTWKLLSSVMFPSNVAHPLYPITDFYFFWWFVNLFNLFATILSIELIVYVVLLSCCFLVFIRILRLCCRMLWLIAFFLNIVLIDKVIWISVIILSISF